MAAVNVASLIATLELDLANFSKGADEMAKLSAKMTQSLKELGAATKPVDDQLKGFGGGALKELLDKFQQGAAGAGIFGAAMGALTSPLGLVALGLGALVAAAQHATGVMTENAIEVQRMMAVSGLSATAADQLADTFKILGVEAGAVGNAMFRMSAELEQGGEGLAKLGIAARDAAGNLKDEGTLFLEVRDRISQLGSSADRNAALIDVFGRSGRALAPVFALSREEFQRWMDQAERLKPWSEEAQRASMDLVRSQNALALAWQGLWVAIGEGLLGPGKQWRDWLAETLIGARSLVEVLRNLGDGWKMYGALAPERRAQMLGQAGSGAAGGGPAELASVGATGGTLTPTSATGPARPTAVDLKASEAALRAAFEMQRAHYAELIALDQAYVLEYAMSHTAMFADQRRLLDEELRMTQANFAARRALIPGETADVQQNAAIRLQISQLEAERTAALQAVRMRGIALRQQEAQYAQQESAAVQAVVGEIAAAVPQYSSLETRLAAVTRQFEMLAALHPEQAAFFQAALETRKAQIIAEDEYAKAVRRGAQEELEREAVSKAGLSTWNQLNELWFRMDENGRQYARTLDLIAAQSRISGTTGLAFDEVAARIQAADDRLKELLTDQIAWREEMERRRQGGAGPGDSDYERLAQNIADADREAQQLIGTLTQLRGVQQLTGLALSVFSGIRGAFMGMTQGILQGTQTFSQAMKNLWVNLSVAMSNAFIQFTFDVIERYLAKLLADILLVNSAMRSGGGGGGGWAGIVMSVLGAVAGAWGGGGGGGGETMMPSSAQGGYGSYTGGTESWEGMYIASGGLVTKPTRAVVGEAGPEMVIPLDSTYGRALFGPTGLIMPSQSGVLPLDSPEAQALFARIWPNEATRPGAVGAPPPMMDPGDRLAQVTAQYQSVVEIPTGSGASKGAGTPGHGEHIEQLTQMIERAIPAMPGTDEVGGAWKPETSGAWAPTPMASGGVVTQPTLILAGERGREAIIPLDAPAAREALAGWPGGGFGGGTRGGGMVEINIIDQRAKGGEIETQQTTGPDQRRRVDILIKDAVKNGVATGEFDALFNSTYGLTRQGARR